MSITKPRWLKQPIPTSAEGRNVRRLLAGLELNTVCREAGCPNRGVCYSLGTATFLILGKICTRGCRFCNIGSGTPEPVEPDEPERVARAAAGMRLKHVVVTSVTRDDLPDGGAGHFAETICELRKHLPEASIEVLIPDFAGNEDALDIVLSARPDVLNHNVETVPQLYRAVRPGADYDRSLRVLARAGAKDMITKSGIMVGLGETVEQLSKIFRDIAKAGVDILTIGQYLSPGPSYYPVKRFVSPKEFENLAEIAGEKGIREVVSGPLVRSSYRAGEAYMKIANNNLKLR